MADYDRHVRPRLSTQSVDDERDGTLQTEKQRTSRVKSVYHLHIPYASPGPFDLNPLSPTSVHPQPKHLVFRSRVSCRPVQCPVGHWDTQSLVFGGLLNDDTPVRIRLGPPPGLIYSDKQGINTDLKEGPYTCRFPEQIFEATLSPSSPFSFRGDVPI